MISLLLSSCKIDPAVLTRVCAMLWAAPGLLDGSLPHRLPIQTLFVLFNILNDALLIHLAEIRKILLVFRVVLSNRLMDMELVTPHSKS